MNGSPPGVEEVGSVLIVGAGLIGTSVGLALRRVGLRPWLVDSDSTAVAVAAARGAGVAAEPGIQPELVVVAVPPGSVVEQVAAALLDYPGAVVTDVASVKGPLLSGLIEQGAQVSRYLGGHPMAGREVSGPLAGRGDLFDDRPWVICPHQTVSARAVRLLHGLIRATHAIPIVLDAAVHDRSVALVSHAPQLVSSLLAARLADASDEALAISGQGLRDMTRIAASDPGLWSQILSANSGAVAGVLSALRGDLERALVALAASDTEGLADLVARGNAGSARVPGKHGGPTAALVVVPVKIADRPGELSRLFAAVDAAGVNVEDARIEHVLGRPTGLVQITVSAAGADRLGDHLRSAGWVVRG